MRKKNKSFREFYSLVEADSDCTQMLVYVCAKYVVNMINSIKLGTLPDILVMFMFFYENLILIFPEV